MAGSEERIPAGHASACASLCLCLVHHQREQRQRSACVHAVSSVPAVPMIHTMERKVKLKTLNQHICCKICKGYLIDATTVTECLHTCKFSSPADPVIEHVTHDQSCPVCKSCLIKHLEEKNTCPSCGIVIHQSHPLNYIAHDRTMQDIVFKLAPNLQQSELSSFTNTSDAPFCRRDQTGERVL